MNLDARTRWIFGIHVRNENLLVLGTTWPPRTWEGTDAPA